MIYVCFISFNERFQNIYMYSRSKTGQGKQLKKKNQNLQHKTSFNKYCEDWKMMFTQRSLEHEWFLFCKSIGAL
jgi:hypothetical protein